MKARLPERWAMVLITAVLPLYALAQNISVSGIFYNLIGDDEVEVTYDEDNCNFIDEDLFGMPYCNDYRGSVVIPATMSYSGRTYRVTTVGESAFRECNKLTAIDLPSSISEVGGRAFEHCTSLKSMTCHSATPPDVSESSFSAEVRRKVTLYVPRSAARAYKSAAVWRDFKEIVEMAASGLKGDVNADGKVDVVDVMAIIGYILNHPTGVFLADVADGNGDGSVDVVDAMIVVAIILGR